MSLSKIESILEKIQVHVLNIETQVGNLQNQVNNLEKRMDSMESRMDSIELKTADGSETYRNCTVKSAWCRHKSADFSILKMVLGCEKREVT